MKRIIDKLLIMLLFLVEIPPREWWGKNEKV
jgi:hypothetical protein